MKVGIYGDVHLTKNMRTFQSVWEDTSRKSIFSMYDRFDSDNVDMVICLGDFFDKPVIEARNLHLILPILDMINSRPYITHMLLGNHEIDDESHNILEYLSEYNNIVPITKEQMLPDSELFLIPYSCDIETIDKDILKDKYIFTHHDIYGSSLAGDKSKAFFGVDPSIFSESKKVFNGHVHLKSDVSDKVKNVGSLTISQLGELSLGDYPSYLILDTESNKLDVHDNIYSMIYLSIDETQTSEVSFYDSNNLVLRVDYDGDIPDNFIDALRISWRKKITSISDGIDDIVKSSSLDFREYLINYIKNDNIVSDTDKEIYCKLGLEMLNS